MKVLVTGGAGYIGSHIVQALRAQNDQVVVIDNLSTGFRNSVPADVVLEHGDIRDCRFLIEVIRKYQIEAIMHLAGKLVVSESVMDPIGYYESNTSGTLSVAKACQTTGVKYVIFSSTGTVYESTNIDLKPIDENSKISPLSPYAWSKYMSEQIIRNCEYAFGLKSVCLRYFNVAGAAIDGTNGQKTQNATYLIKRATEVASGKGDSLCIFGTDYSTPDGTAVRDYIHVEDLAGLHLQALKYLISGRASEIFNCGYGYGYSVKDVIRAVEKISGKKIKIFYQPRRMGDAASLVADSGKIKKYFNWRPQRDSLDVICETAYRWELQHRS